MSSQHLRADWQNAVTARIAHEVTRPLNVANQLMTTDGFLYPFRGVYFFCQHYQQMLPIFLSVVLPYAVLHLYIYTILLAAILPLNLVIHTLTSGPLGIHTGIFNTLHQCSCLNNYIFKNYLIKGKLNKIFDTTLCLVGLDRVVIPGKLKRLVPQTLGAQLMEVNPINLTITIARALYTVIVSLIPIIGTFASHYNRAIYTASSSQERMMRLTRQRPRQVSYQVKEHEGELFTFGLVCMFLEGLPFLGLLFCFTDHVGAALLASDLYKGTNGSAVKKDILVFNMAVAVPADVEP